jgi:hypothetical protein
MTLAGAIHTLHGPIHDLVHAFWQGIRSAGEILTDFAIPTQDSATANKTEYTLAACSSSSVRSFESMSAADMSLLSGCALGT